MLNAPLQGRNVLLKSGGTTSAPLPSPLRLCRPVGGGSNHRLRSPLITNYAPAHHAAARVLLSMQTNTTSAARHNAFTSFSFVIILPSRRVKCDLIKSREGGIERRLV